MYEPKVIPLVRRDVEPRKPTAPEITVLVPTRNEVGNVGPLAARLERAMAGVPIEVIFVDDSDDGTGAAVAELTSRRDFQVGLIHRTPAERIGGLGGAVVAGLRAARGAWVCVIDADLQHPPEVVAQLRGRAQSGDVDLVVASRFCEAGGVGDFGPLRRALSRVSSAAGRFLFPSRLRAISDPMSGFFMFRRDAVDPDVLQPKGFKILLEIAVRTADLRVAEVPFVFGTRHSGDSKASPREAARYVAQIWGLGIAGLAKRLGRFGLVGATGLAVNTLLLGVLVGLAGWNYLVAAVIATQGSSLWNFALTDRWVFRGRDYARTSGSRLGLFLLMNNIALVVRVPVLWALTAGLGIQYLVSNILSLVVLMLLRFGLSDGWIWRGSERTSQRLFNYDIHGIITVSSDGRLPELARFQVDADLSDPTIRVRIGRLPKRAEGELPTDTVRYEERFGRLGFGTEIRIAERVDILAAPLLRCSPHVLYTNIVEPVLRWSFVERGYALVHAACMADGEHGFLITARTDTGKTTTALKSLDNLPYSFLSDDLTLLRPDGRVLTYAKPLTISRHTLSAVKAPLLTRGERAALIVQSRLHSKSGRLFGLILARTGLPAATMNAYIQMLVPPPKFQVDRLVPGVAIAPEAQVTGMAIIQREGDEGFEHLASDEALEVLLSNCEDAYGFPPYPVIEGFLHSGDGRDLKAVERAIVMSGLEHVPATLMRSYDRNWYAMFQPVVRHFTEEYAARTGRVIEAGSRNGSSPESIPA